MPQVTTNLLVLSSASAMPAAPVLPASLILPPVSVAVVPTVFKASLSRWVSASMPGGSQNPVDAPAACAVGSDVPPALDMASAIWPAAEAIAFICATALPAWLFQLSSAAPKVWKAEPELSSAASKR